MAFYTILANYAATVSATNILTNYEISNFALPGRRSLHNSGYWLQTPYLGIGAAAHSFDGGSRQWNVSDLDQYIQGVENGHWAIQQETLDADTRYNELVMTRLRTCEGLPLDMLSPSQLRHCTKEARRWIDSGLLSLTPADSHLRLTRQGIFVSDMVMSALFI